MNRGKRPPCIGMYGAEDECRSCGWRQECQEMAEDIESAATRKGTHVRIVSKYKEKKYKPKRVP
jgi:disulfide oxidoreductase YuzD